MSRSQNPLSSPAKSLNSEISCLNARLHSLCVQILTLRTKKVLFVISFLRGSALSWAPQIPENEDHPLRHDYDAFKTALSNLYLDRNYKALCESKLLRLKQTKSAAAYSVEFQSIVSALDLDENSKCLFFYERLNPDVKDAIALVGRETTFSALVDQAISIDQRMYQRRIETKKPDSSHASKPSTPKPSPHPNASPKPTKPPFASSNSNPSAYKPHFPPSMLSQQRGPLTDEEKLYRKQNKLCGYCGNPDHDFASCPRIRAKEAKANALSLVPFYPQPTPLTAPHVRPLNPENPKAQAPTRSEA